MKLGQRPMPPHYYRDLAHGPVVRSGFCPGSRRRRARIPLVVAWDFFVFCGFLAVVSRPLLAQCFPLCNLRLSVMKRILLLFESCTSEGIRKCLDSHAVTFHQPLFTRPHYVHPLLPREG
jgi:hypothetical protein